MAPSSRETAKKSSKPRQQRAQGSSSQRQQQNANEQPDGIDNFATRQITEAKRIIRDEFPAKILRLTEMLNGEGLSMNRLTEVRDITANSTVAITDNTAVTAADDGGNPAKKRRLMQTIGVPSNNIIAQIVAELRDEVEELRAHADLLQQWSTLATPSYVNAGHDLHKNVASAMADGCCATTEAWMNDLTSYHSSRAENVREILKHVDADPALSDAVRDQIVEDDVQWFISLRRTVVGVRCHYIHLYDYFLKNWDQLHRDVGSQQTSAMHG